MTPSQLKNSILQLAIEGKLVEPREEEGTAEELFKKIQEEKQKLIEEKKIKKEKPLPEITEDEKPFDIPSNWKWVRLGELGSYKKGPFGSALTKNIFVQKGHNTIKVYEQKNAIRKDAFIGEYYITKEYFEQKLLSFEVKPGDIIVSCAGTIGETYILPDNIEKGIINQALMRMRLFSHNFIPYFLIFFDFILKQSVNLQSKGSAIKNIPPFDILKKYLVPLPPLEEQKRIVEKLEQILPYIEQYEKSWNELETLNINFPNKLKKSLLQYAIEGKLVEQRKEEGTAEELFEKIQEEKQKLIAEKKIKKEKPLPEITEDEKPFDIPSNWKWVRLGEILIKLVDGTHHTPKYTNSGIPFISVKNISNGKLDFKDTKFISEDEHNILFKRCNPEKNDLLLSKIGTTGIPVKVDTNKPFSLFVSVALLKFNNQMIDIDFLMYTILSPIIQKQCKKNTKGVGNKNWVIKDITNTIIPLPPLKEQKRIVEKLEQLIPLCEKLNQQNK